MKTEHVLRAAGWRRAMRPFRQCGAIGVRNTGTGDCAHPAGWLRGNVEVCWQHALWITRNRDGKS